MHIYQIMENILLELENSQNISIKNKEAKIMYYTQEVFRLQTEILESKMLLMHSTSTIYPELGDFKFAFDQEKFWRAKDVKSAIQKQIYKIEQFSGDLHPLELDNSLVNVFCKYFFKYTSLAN